MKLSRTVATSFWASITLLGLSACEKSNTDLQQFVNQTLATPPGRVEPIPEFEPYQKFEYTMQHLRDPFEPSDFRPEPEEVASTSGIRPDIDRPREPLEDFPLDTLRMKGTVTKEGLKWALIFAPDNTIHRVIEGQYLGQNFGRVTGVSDEKVELIEIIPDGLGGYLERAAALGLID